MVKKFYEAPEMEMIQLTVEAGFAASYGGSDGADGSGSGGYDDGEGL